MLSQVTIDTVKSTASLLESRGLEITNTFYRNMFKEHPELLDLFNNQNQKGGRQPAALANAIYAAAKHIDNLTAILPAVMIIAHKHRSLGVLPEHYPIVGSNLLRAIKEVLGDVATDKIINAWGEAYGVISDVFIQVEEDLYKKAEANGGWRFYKNFKLVRKEKENDAITSFYFQPEDQSQLPPYIPGQYIGLRMKLPNEPNILNRQYTISQAPVPDLNVYRISVKREDDHTPHGRVSTHLHKHSKIGDIVEISAPAGDFNLQKNKDPIVFISGGVGVTPLYSMLEAVSEGNKVTFLHAARNERVIAFKEAIAKKILELNGKHLILYSDQGRFVTFDLLQEVVQENAHYYLCGPIPFMEGIIQNLKNLGVPFENIHFEFFGPALNLT